MANSPITRVPLGGHPQGYLVLGVVRSPMAEYPCDMHLGRYAGPSTRAYLNLYREECEAKFKASICGECLAIIMGEWLSRALVQSGEGYWNPPEDGADLESIFRPRSGPSGPLRRVS